MADKKRLIDANALKKAIREERWVKDRKIQIALEYIGLIIDEQLTVDAVEVVRCKDCVHMKNQFHARFCKVWCMYNGMGDEGFCNYGERKENYAD